MGLATRNPRRRKKIGGEGGGRRPAGAMRMHVSRPPPPRPAAARRSVPAQRASATSDAGTGADMYLKSLLYCS